jgi:hypothetical protein
MAVITAALIALSAPAFARGGGGGGGGGGMTVNSMPTSRGFSSGMPRGFSSGGQRTGFRSASTPPGWSHGKKTGWHGGTMPPGLAKKTTSTTRTGSRTTSR